MKKVIQSKHAMHAERVALARSTYQELIYKTDVVLDRIRAEAPNCNVFEWSLESDRYIQCTGSEALEKVLTILGQYDRFTNQEVTSVVRLPGVVFLNESFAEAITKINELKQGLHNQIISIPPGSRNRLTTQAFGFGTSTLQLYRQWHQADNDTIKISFTEAKAGSAISWITVADLLKRITESIDHPSEGTDHHLWNKMLEIEAESLNEFHHTVELMIQKPVARHPRLLIYKEIGSRHVAMKGASIPLICYAPLNKVKIKPFTDTQGYNVHRNDSHLKKCIIERLHVFYVEGGRKRITRNESSGLT